MSEKQTYIHGHKKASPVSRAQLKHSSVLPSIDKKDEPIIQLSSMVAGMTDTDALNLASSQQASEGRTLTAEQGQEFLETKKRLSNLPKAGTTPTAQQLNNLTFARNFFSGT